MSLLGALGGEWADPEPVVRAEPVGPRCGACGVSVSSLHALIAHAYDAHVVTVV